MSRFSFPLILLLSCACQAEEPQPPPIKKEKVVSHTPAKNQKHTNALSKETSPYLLQHAHNPVNWYPWGPEAFEKATKEDKPIFLSVGYSSCHWCHVMERESFEKEDVAKILNEHFISIKVDREERPDVDEIYMTAVQIVTQHGGWPMSVFMSADGKPFFGGTYFPPEDSANRMGFKSLLTRVHEVWIKNRADVKRDAERLSEAIIERLTSRSAPSQRPLDRTLLENCIDTIHGNFDRKLGGFGRRPKFPPNNGLPLLIYMHSNARRTDPDPRIQEMTRVTLDNMALGGIHDQLAGGFHRYSTDERWLVPHFEKMLYDNAMLSRSYAEASVVFSNPEYERVARGVYEWVLREMTSPEGAFFSTLDADSEGVEGKFYVWNKKEITQLLGADAETFCTIFNVHAEGNFKEEATGEDTGHNILHLTEALSVHATKLKIPEAELIKKIVGWKATLLAVRIKRIWPGLDDKILTAWNGLMIASLARGSIWLKEPRYKDAAIKAAEFMLKHQRTDKGRWLATHRHGQSKLPAYLDDHAFMAVAFLDLFEATRDERWKKEAIGMFELMDAHFTDPKGGGYFFIADDHEKLLARTKDPVDKAIPSGNGWAAQALVRLYVLTGDKRYQEKATRMFSEFQGLMETIPHASESLLLAVGWHLDQLPVQAAGAPVEASKITSGVVTSELFVGASALQRGAKVPVAVRFTLGNGFHIQAGGPDADGEDGGATRVAVSGLELGALSGLKFPKSEILKMKAPGTDLKIYSGTPTISGVLEVPAAAPLGMQTLKIKVHFQACNDRQCQAPADITLALPIEVVEKDAAVQKRNEKIFEQK